MKVIEYSVPMRAAIFYTPIGLMTSRNVYGLHRELLLKEAARFISTIFEIFKHTYDAEKTIIHCGNLGGHAQRVNAHLEQLGYSTLVHQEGKLKETVDQFLSGKEQVLLIVSGEYGFDFKDIMLQFILKVPYAAMDERLRALERTIGKEQFNRWYSMDALNRLVQEAGRVGRGAGGFGCTFILDSKFSELERRYGHLLPKWFKERMQ